MSTASLPVNCGIEQLAEGLGSAGVLGDGWESVVIFFPKSGRVDPSALTFLLGHVPILDSKPAHGLE